MGLDQNVQKIYSLLRNHLDDQVFSVCGEAFDRGRKLTMAKSTTGASYKSVGASQCGTNLREWLGSTGSYTRNTDKLRLFRQIVQIVDIAHSQGIVLLDLRPSSFILSENGDVTYIGTEIELLTMNSNYNTFCSKKRKIGEGTSMIRSETERVVESTLLSTSNIIDEKNSFDIVELENKWYACPEGLNVRDLLPSNIYCLGLLLFEFLSHFESKEAHSAAMLALHHRILPPRFLCENPKEAAFCLWLLHPEPSSRPSAREILESELIHGSGETSDIVEDAESEDLLHHFLVSLEKHKQNKASELCKNLEFLKADIKEVETRYKNLRQEEPNAKDPRTNNVLRDKLLKNMNQLEDAYFTERSRLRLTETPNMDRSDKDILSTRDRWSSVQTSHGLPTLTEQKTIDRVGTFFDDIRKFARYNEFEVCGTLRNVDLLGSESGICSLSFDRDEEYIAAAGVSKKTKIFEFNSLLNDSIDVQYPVLELSNKSKLSCVCWNNYIKNYLASTDYDGLVQVWDARTGQVFTQYNEHRKRAWSVDFSRVDAAKFASGGDDCSVRIWSINDKNSIGAIWNPANVCCVQFSAFSSHLLAFGSSNHKIYCYDLRHTRIPWCTLAGHGNSVSYVRFLDSETIVSASTDSTLKIWDLKKTSLEGLSSDACTLTLTGHTNEKSFVGLAVSDEYIACGSETNEVYAYYRSLPMPITCHKFGTIVDPTSGGETSGSRGHFVSSVCWRRKSEMVVAANSSGSLKILRLV